MDKKDKDNPNNYHSKKYNFIIILIIAFVLVANYYSYYLLNQKSREKNQTSYLKHQKLQTTTVIHSIENTIIHLKEHFENTENLYNDIFTEKDKDVYSKIFENFIVNQEEIESLTYYNKDLNILYDFTRHKNKVEEINKLNSEWINSYLPLINKIDKDSYIPMISADKEDQYMGFIIPFEINNEMKSFFIVTVDLNLLIKEFVDLVEIPEQSEVFVVDRYGSTLYSNNNEDYGKTIFEINRSLSGLLEIYNEFISTKDGFDEYSIDKDGEKIKYLLSWDSFTIDSRKIILTISTPKDYIYNTLNVVTQDIITLNIIITLLLVLFIYIFYRMKNRNLIQLKNHFEKLANKKSKEYFESQKLLTEKNIHLQEAFEELENTNKKLLDKKWALEKAFSNNQILTSRFENIINLISEIDITSQKSLENFLVELFDTALKVIPEADYGSIFLYKKDYIKYLKTKGHDIHFLNSMRIPTTAFSQFERSRSIIVEHIENVDLPGMTEEEKDIFRKTSKPMKQSITFNLMIENKKIAGISLDIDQTSDKNFDENSLQIMEAFRSISNIFLKIQNYQLELNRKATYDSLTSTYNRRMILEILGQNIKIAKRDNTPLSVCFMDVDKLKYINDHLGHKIGDKLLLDVSRIIKENKREADSLARIGGDEFLIVFPDCSKKDAEVIWARINEDFEKFNKENNQYKIQVSHGISEFNKEHRKNVDELITEADEKMYEEKNRKRGGEQ